MAEFRTFKLAYYYFEVFGPCAFVNELFLSSTVIFPPRKLAVLTVSSCFRELASDVTFD